MQEAAPGALGERAAFEGSVPQAEEVKLTAEDAEDAEEIHLRSSASSASSAVKVFQMLKHFLANILLLAIAGLSGPSLLRAQDTIRFIDRKSLKEAAAASGNIVE